MKPRLTKTCHLDHRPARRPHNARFLFSRAGCAGPERGRSNRRRVGFPGQHCGLPIRDRARRFPPPFLSSPSLGRWQPLGGGHYSATFRFFRFLPDGTNTGLQKVTRDIQLDPGGSTFTGTVSFETSDTAGNVIATGCGTETSVRVVD